MMKDWKRAIGSVLMTLMFGSCALGISEMSVAELELKYATGASRFVDVDGLRVHYRDEGEGKTLLVLHGILASLHTWEGWSEHLRHHYRVISLDLPPFGLTGPANFTYSLENYLHFIERFVQQLGLKSFVLAGNSLGGYFAWNYAIEHPEQIEQLVLIDAAAYAQKVPLPMRLFTMPVIGSLATHMTLRFLVASMVRDAFGDPSRASETLIDRYYELQLRPGNRKAAQELFIYANTLAASDADGIDRISMPTLIMWGEQDRWIPLPYLERWRHDLPHAVVITYPNVGHMPMEEISERTANDLHKFLSSDR